jgi:RimJ/RimL family protein N-acetyltransferase
MLEGKTIRLVVLEKKHLPEIVKHWNNPEMRIFLGEYIPNSPQQEESWFEHAQERMNKRKDFYFAIELLESHDFLGTVGLHDVNWISRSAVLGITIHEKENWSKGYGSEALQLIIDYAWTHLNLRRIELSVHDFNSRAKHVYEKLGFKEYGLAHEQNYINGKYVNTCYMELMRNES